MMAYRSVAIVCKSCRVVGILTGSAVIVVNLSPWQLEVLYMFSFYNIGLLVILFALCCQCSGVVTINVTRVLFSSPGANWTSKINIL